MANYAEKYRSLSNLQLRKLLGEVDKLGPEAAAALRAEVNGRGLAPPPRRVSKTGKKVRNRFGKQLTSWFDLGASPGNRRRSEELLDAPMDRNSVDLEVADRAARRLTLAWLAYTLFTFVYAGLFTRLFISESYLNSYNPAYSLYEFVPYILYLMTLAGLFTRKHWGLAGAAFFMGYHGMFRIQSWLTAFKMIGNMSFPEDLWWFLWVFIVPALFIVYVVYHTTRVGVPRAFDVGPKFVQSYIFIGISLGILFSVVYFFLGLGSWGLNSTIY